MRLLFLTQVLDAGDAVLGFVPRWIEGLARHCERVRVVALEVGEKGGLPANVDVREVGRKGSVRRYLRYKSYLREALARDGFTTVLAHMVPRYSLLARGPARAAGARSFLWYTHGAVDSRLRRAVASVEKVFTASEESLRVATEKRVVTGHGIDLEHFASRGEPPARPPRLLAVGRLSPAKDPLTLLAATGILVARGHDLQVDLVGGALAPGDETYVRRVREQIEVGALAQRVTLHGAVPYREVPRFYRACSVLVSPSLTGSVDKVVLEAMACERPVVTCNDSFTRLFRDLDPGSERLLFRPGSAEHLAERLEALLALAPRERAELGSRLRALVARDHEVDALMRRLFVEMGGRP